MRIHLVLTEAKPDDLWTTGEVKNVSAPGSPTITPATCRLKAGPKFIAGPGMHAYRFEIRGDGEIKVQAIDADTGAAVAAPGSFDTSVVHGGHTYVFEVVV